ncbi:multisubunit sodium/proton antiporter, MrpF subunit [Neorhodopirellula lusitana]|uniref:Multisubunit sodium/proton antiporter, MrpF subunit n=1 Tax=Neorhodopirellula lusitana TaxID=445327 RepID=A0ABY1QEW2_9BACT|nr:monovalent cation/H+ antiporter complex subunit F [Neorhodopirellula lusitana]SMP68740.1 multisubunit sodium/proton antiporter, MrpF subunit [Neorhodopirellula lusitana]
MSTGFMTITTGILAVTSFAVLVTMTLALTRATLGPTVFDRVLALNMFGTKTVLLASVVSFMSGRQDFLDLALLYSLMNFIGMVALLRFTEYNNFGGEEHDEVGQRVSKSKAVS